MWLRDTAVTCSTLSRVSIVPNDILLRDLDLHNVESGQRLIANTGLPGRFELGDAFDRASLAALRPRPTIGIVSIRLIPTTLCGRLSQA